MEARDWWRGATQADQGQCPGQGAIYAKACMAQGSCVYVGEEALNL